MDSRNGALAAQSRVCRQVGFVKKIKLTFRRIDIARKRLNALSHSAEHNPIKETATT